MIFSLAKKKCYLYYASIILQVTKLVKVLQIIYNLM